jgi:hypothetical protein
MIEIKTSENLEGGVSSEALENLVGHIGTKVYWDEFLKVCDHAVPGKLVQFKTSVK